MATVQIDVLIFFFFRGIMKFCLECIIEFMDG